MGGLISVNVHQLDVKSMKDRDRFEVIKEELIKHPERSNEKNKQGETPLHECAKKGSGIERMIELFVSHGGDCNIPNSDGLTVLHINCQYGGGLIDLFVQKGAKVNALDNMGQPPVFYALATRDVSVIEASLAALHSQPGSGADLFFDRNCGNTERTSASKVKKVLKPIYLNRAEH